MDASDPDPDSNTPEARAARYLRAAKHAVDTAFGPGHAAAHPELVAAVVQASAIEHAISAGEMATEEALATIRRLSRETNETLLKLKPRIFG
ncbi:MAG: hypothetical protein AAGE76_16020 [Pseudomonadota bacterium]